METDDTIYIVQKIIRKQLMYVLEKADGINNIAIEDIRKAYNSIKENDYESATFYLDDAVVQMVHTCTGNWFYIRAMIDVVQHSIEVSA